VQLKGPDSTSAGRPAKFSAILIGGAGAPTFKWSLSEGRIASGQGTPTITVDTAGLAGSSIIVTLELGLPRVCVATGASVSLLIGP
jgi:hypothetical protein